MSKPVEVTTPLSAMDFHVLLVLAAGDLYGYAIMKAVEEESGGALSPEIGSLYRVLNRLVDAGLVGDAPTPTDAEPGSRGRPRRYYRLTPEGHRALQLDARRLEAALDLARSRTAVAGGPSR